MIKFSDETIKSFVGDFIIAISVIFWFEFLFFSMAVLSHILEYMDKLFGV